MRRRGLIAAGLATGSSLALGRALARPASLAGSERGEQERASVAISSAARCNAPDPPAPRGGRKLEVRDFGAVGDGRHDDTAALKRALAALQPLDTLRFGPGRFVHASRLAIGATGVRLVADGASLHATNPADQALLIQADGVVVRGFTLTAVTDRRRDAPWESRIAIWRDGARAASPVRDVHILDNRIVEAGAPGMALANSSSSAAIFVHHAARFTIARNLVHRSLADAIHVTGGSTQGRVIGNTVRESGDDMVAVVSYLPSDLERVRGVSTLVREVLIADNDLSGQYWGRGISVVGGEGVTIMGNRVDAATHAAGVYIAREAAYRTHGVRRVLVTGNAITRVQTTAPDYAVLEPARQGRRTGHGAIEVVAQIADDERAGAEGQGLGVHDVRIEGNTIDDVGTDGIRIGDGWSRRLTVERVQADGSIRPIGATAAPVRRVTVLDNRVERVQGAPIVVFNTADAAAALKCSGNTHDGKPIDHGVCASAAGSTQRSTTAAASDRTPYVGAPLRCATSER